MEVVVGKDDKEEGHLFEYYIGELTPRGWGLRVKLDK